MALREQADGREEMTSETVPFRMHPRVFAALGENLVTDDVVAVIELVKNSFDAFARNVRVAFGEDPIEGPLLEITDDGVGMTREIIEDVWCTVATPYKDGNPVVTRGGRERRVVGEKGLGRLSAARLGSRLRMLTQAARSPCWEVVVDWAAISRGDDLSQSFVGLREYRGESPFEESGTRLVISGLSGRWDDDRIADLKDNLARLISPFSEMDDFNIRLRGFDSADEGEIRITPPAFLSHPKYAIKGTADAHGGIEAVYRFAPLAGGEGARTRNLHRSQESIRAELERDGRFNHPKEGARCGPFSFEIRAWDIGAPDTAEIADAFGYSRGSIRRAIAAHKGISVYRDGVLVLPKSETARDWLGLDLRRVSRVGQRLSTSQIVGYVSISADGNPHIVDTSDRERLVSRAEVSEFEAIIRAAVGLLETERGNDRIRAGRERPLRELFSGLSAEPLVTKVHALAEEGAKASSVVPLVREFSGSLAATRKTIEERFVYYSRLATVGTIAQMLVHEIRNRTIALGGLLKSLKKVSLFLDKDDEDRIRNAQTAVDALESLADGFAPLASRRFRRDRRSAVLEDRIRGCLNLLQHEIRGKGIEIAVPGSRTTVAVDPGELDAILLNLMGNSTYWMGEVPDGTRRLEFAIESVDDGKRVRLWVHDTGPGIDDEDAEKIFLPGVTRKPNGIGMGLTVASELVDAYGGRMLTKRPGERGGASFAFDLPLWKPREGKQC